MIFKIDKHVIVHAQLKPDEEKQHASLLSLP